MSVKRIFAKVARSPVFLAPACLASAVAIPISVNMAVNHDLSTEAVVQDERTEEYRERMSHLRHDAKWEFQQEDHMELAKDLVLDESINEREFKEFASYFPARDNHDLLPRPSRADSLDECRLEYGDAGIAANDTAIAANIISCMRNNNLLSSWLTIVLSIVSAAGFAGVASMASSSPKLKQWATEPPKKGN